ncbi:MAG: SDR family NAD(P)-dependent oxidoreductase, partial [Bacteroidetes bacterium]|nr:SDR family NAD(P)-dependent oxidoreductase [Bacteroidota bacterium]
MTIKGKTYLVSGGASGLGLATAKMLIENGGNVILLDINKELGEKVEVELGEKARF